MRQDLADAAIKLAKAVGYYSAGTVEFIFDTQSKQFFFMEMNTRIQVEHPVTEAITGVDLIREQIRIANGEKLTYAQEDIRFIGHSIECRINAEHPKNYTPSPGKIDHYHRPGGLGIRVDDFVYTGYHVKPFYDSMISKIIVHAPNRLRAIERMKRALNETVVGGIDTNIDLHKKIMDESSFQEGLFDTNYLNEKVFFS